MAIARWHTITRNCGAEGVFCPTYESETFGDLAVGAAVVNDHCGLGSNFGWHTSKLSSSVRLDAAIYVGTCGMGQSRLEREHFAMGYRLQANRRDRQYGRRADERQCDPSGGEHGADAARLALKQQLRKHQSV